MYLLGWLNIRVISGQHFLHLAETWHVSVVSKKHLRVSRYKFCYRSLRTPHKVSEVAKMGDNSPTCLLLLPGLKLWLNSRVAKHGVTNDKRATCPSVVETRNFLLSPRNICLPLAPDLVARYKLSLALYRGDMSHATMSLATCLLVKPGL